LRYGAGAVTGTDSSPLGHGGKILAGLIGGWIAGAGAGVIDGLVSWGPSAQFLPGFGERLLFLLHQLSSSGLIGALVGLGLALLVALLGATRLGELVRAMGDESRRASLVALLLMAPPVLVLTGRIAFGFAVEALGTRRHVGLQLGSAMLLGVGALLGAALVALVFALPLERLLEALARKSPRFGRVLRHRATPKALAAVVASTTIILGVLYFRELIALLPLRGVWVALGGLVLAFPSYAAGRVYARSLSRRHAAVRLGIVLFLVLGSAGGTLATGGLPGVRQAVTTFTGLGGVLLERYRGLVDMDGDGYSSILGGGDCDDFDPTAHPGGTEIPGDGIDQNCIGGDAVLERDPAEVGFAALPPSIPTRTNVLLITIDTVRADHFGSYGYDRDTTPNIDAVAEEGIVFENAWAHAPSTRYSMPAILTGRYPLNVYYDRSIRPWPGLQSRATTLAEIMHAKGLRAGAITNHWYFGRQRRMNQGFDTYDNDNSRLHRQDPRRGPATSHGSSSSEQTDAAISFLEDVGSRRFFLWVHYYDPHHEYEAHEGTRSFGDEPVDLYDHEILFTDHHVGRLLTDLEERGLADDTIVVITGDHGEGFGEHGVDFHGYHLYAAQTKVPFIMRIPGVAPRRVRTAVGHVDILPTLANLVGAEPSEEMMGESLLGLALGEVAEDPTRYVFQQVAWTGNDIRGAASAECHVIHNVRPHSSWELYRVETDPNEMRNVIDHPGPCADAKPTLEAFLDWSELTPEGGPTQEVLEREPAVQHRVDVDAGDELRLVGIDLPDEPVRRGRRMEITWTWKVRGQMTSGYRVFAHIRGLERGRFLADHDPPRPFETWPEDRWVRYTTSVNVPHSAPRGEYVINFGVYRGRSRKPLQSEVVEITDLNEAKIATLEVR
jgi:arylsulfatase A-like enzyme